MATDGLPRPGTDERRRYLQLGEALLTDDGRITSTPQAMTIAIEALAARMRSSTPELVLAATGLIVGSDMAGRLGDSRYVLVAHHERYPWMGADVLHLDELGSDMYRPSAHRAVRMDTEQAERLVRMVATSQLMGAWSYGSNNNARVLALQEITRDEFGLQGALVRPTDSETQSATDRELKYNRDALADFLRTQYTVTQEVLQARGISEVISYRVHSWSEDAERPPWADAGRVGDVVEAPQRPLARWSPDRRLIADRLKARGPGVILAARHSASEIVSLPMTGMTMPGQKEWVTLPGDHRAMVDGIVSDPRIGERARSAAHGAGLGDSVLGSNASERERSAAASAGLDGLVVGSNAVKTPEVTPEVAPGWQPHTVAARLSSPDQLDARLGRILDGKEEAPSWWPRDDSGYSIARRDLEFLRIDPQHLRWMLTGEAPVGLTPRLYRQFAAELRVALQRDHIEAAQVDVRLKGTAAGFFSGLHKTLPTEAELAGKPEALDRMRKWFGSDENRPLRRPYDAMYRLGLEPEPSDYDLDINSTAAVRAARDHWREHHGDRYPGDFMGGHGYLDKQAVHGALPNLADWAKRWEDRLSRPLSLGVFESTGPFDEAALGRRLSAHFKDSDWIIHRRQKITGPNLPRPQSRAATARPDHRRREYSGMDRSGRRGGRG